MWRVRINNIIVEAIKGIEQEKQSSIFKRNAFFFLLLSVFVSPIEKKQNKKTKQNKKQNKTKQKKNNKKQTKKTKSDCTKWFLKHCMKIYALDIISFFSDLKYFAQESGEKVA